MQACADVDPARFRRVLGRFATGVTVVTGVDASAGAEPVGFACQSFAAVSLEPPLVLFCADHRGRAWPRIRTTGRFCVNVLAEEQRELCERFGSRAGHRFDGLDWELSAWGCPALPGVLARVHADVEVVHTSGDHDVVVGRVRELEALDEPGSAVPLVFYRGGFSLDPVGEAFDTVGRGWDWG